MLNEQGRYEIEQAVQRGERKTSGEIRVAWLPASDDYASTRERLGVIAMTVAMLVAWFTGLVGHQDWGASPVADTLRVLLVLAGGYAIGRFALGSIPWLRRAVISEKKLTATVRSRAVQAFNDNGLSKTAERNGVLVFVSEFERRVEILADTGIHEKYPHQDWTNICSSICTGIGGGIGSTAVSWAVWKVAEMLAAHFPRKENDKNELPDTIITQ
jgi:putative membrane protein